VILIVEGEFLVRRLMVNALRQAGYHVLPVADGPEALTAAGELPIPPAVLVTNLEMDPIDGVTLSRMMRSRHPAVRVLYTGGYGTASEVGDVPGRVLVKPFSPQQLVRAIEEVLGTP
jgi:CheY-like chemotaxis protein